MKKVIILAAVGLISFLVGTAGVYLAMPSLSPETVDSTRVRLDSLGLLTTADSNPADSISLPPASLSGDSARAGDSTGTDLRDVLPTPQEIIQSLRDSLNRVTNTIHDLQSDTANYSRQLSDLAAELSTTKSKREEADELSASLSKLEDKQLSQILAGLDLGVIEMLYEQSSARERTRLLQSMSPDQAAKFVRTLVRGSEAAREVASQEDSPTETPPQQAQNGPSNR